MSDVVVKASLAKPCREDLPVVKVTLPGKVAKNSGLIKKEKRLWDNYREVGEVRKNNKIKFVVGAAVRDGVRYLNIREFYLRKSDGVWKAGRDGITIPIMIPVEEATLMLTPFKELIKLLTEAADYVMDMELYDPEHAIIVVAKEKKGNQ